jgi:hypothetical protein
MATLMQLGVLALGVAAGYMSTNPKQKKLGMEVIYLLPIFLILPTVLQIIGVGSISLYGVFLSTLTQAFIIGIAVKLVKAQL